MSREELKRRYSVADHTAATQGVKCRKDEHVTVRLPWLQANRPSDKGAERPRRDRAHVAPGAQGYNADRP